MKNEEDNNQETGDKDTIKSTQNRRKVIKSVAAIGGGVAIGKSFPDKWHRPFVDAVLLPAHAQTSDNGGDEDDAGERSSPSSFGGTIGVTVVASNSLGRDRNKSLASTLADIVVSPAHAHSETVTIDSGCVNLDGSSVDVSLSTTEGSLGGTGQVGEEISLSPNPAGSIRDAFITLTTVTDSNVSPSVITQVDYDLVFDIVDEGADTTHADNGPGAHGRVGSWNKLESSC